MMKKNQTAFAVLALLVLAVLVQGVSGAPNGPPAKVDGRGGFTWVGGDSTVYDADFLLHAVQLDPATGAASGTAYVRIRPRDAPGSAIWWRVGVTHLLVGGSGGFGVAGAITKTNSPLEGAGKVGDALALLGSASAENGDTIFVYLFPKLEDALGVFQGGGFGSASLTWGEVTIR